MLVCVWDLPEGGEVWLEVVYLNIEEQLVVEGLLSGTGHQWVLCDNNNLIVEDSGVASTR